MNLCFKINSYKKYDKQTWLTTRPTKRVLNGTTTDAKTRAF